MAAVAKDEDACDDDVDVCEDESGRAECAVVEGRIRGGRGAIVRTAEERRVNIAAIVIQFE